MNELLNKIKNKYKDRIIVTNCGLNAFSPERSFFIRRNSILKIKDVCKYEVFEKMFCFYFEYKETDICFVFNYNNIDFDESGNCIFLKIIKN